MKILNQQFQKSVAMKPNAMMGKNAQFAQNMGKSVQAQLIPAAAQEVDAIMHPTESTNA